MLKTSVYQLPINAEPMMLLVIVLNVTKDMT